MPNQPLTAESILKAAHVGENTDWEFKSARGGFPGSFWETYSAMANAEGGAVVLGASQATAEDAIRLDGLGDEQIARYQRVLWDGLNNRGQTSRNLLEPADVEIIDTGGGRLLAIRIRRATRTERPVYLGQNPFGHTYRRRHEGDYRLADAEVRRMLADADEIPPDQRILEGVGLADLDSASIALFRKRMQATRPDHPWLDLGDRDLLERLGGWRRDLVSGAEGVTLAGMLMFGRDRVITAPSVAPKYFIDYRERLDSETRWTDRLYPDGTWEANLFQFYLRAWPKLSAGLPVPFRLEGGQRRDVTPAHEALREAFVNALIHADYSAPGGIVIERLPDRFVLSNPGTLLVSLEQYLAGGVSESRNKSLQQMFLMIGGGERAGSGADRIRSGWRAQHWRAPRIELREGPDRVEITLPMVSLIPAETLERLRRRFGTGTVDDLQPPELQALATADIEGIVSNSRLQQLLHDHPTDITRTLSRLCDRGLLVSHNRGRWTSYRLPEALPTETEPSLFSDVPESAPRGSGHSEGDSGRKTRDSGHNGADSGHKPTEPSPRAIPHGRVPKRALAELRKKAQTVSQTQRTSPAVMAAAIQELCRGRYLTAEQLGKLVNRNPEALRKRYLTPMAADGALRLRFPDAPNRPDQAYTAVESE